MFPISLLAGLLFVAVACVVLLWSRLVKEKQKNAELSGPSGSRVKVMKGVSRLDPASNALFATLSHELRTPMNGLLGIVQMLNEEKEDEDLQAIEGCARHMLAVITTLVNHSKIQEEWMNCLNTANG